jgi:hypothetical protein
MRRSHAAIVAGGGVMTLTDSLVTAVSGLTVQVAPGQLWIPGTEGGATAGMPSGLYSDGVYYCYQDATLNLTCAAANPTNPRIDLVCAVVNNAEYTSPGYGSSNTWTPAIVTGTPASSPSAPSLPGNAIALATVAVAAGASTVGTITNEQAAARLGIYPAFSLGSPSIGSLANGSTTPVALGTIVVPTATRIRVLFSASFTITGTFQALTINNTVDGTNVSSSGVGGTSYIQTHMTSGDTFWLLSAGSTHVTAGSHSIGVSLSVGGGGASLAPSEVYWEAQAVAC